MFPNASIEQLLEAWLNSAHFGRGWASRHCLVLLSNIWQLSAQVFDSHCAPEPIANMQPEQLTIAKLKERLKELNLPLNGRKVSNCIHVNIYVLWLPCTL